MGRRQGFQRAALKLHASELSANCVSDLLTSLTGAEISNLSLPYTGRDASNTWARLF